MVMIDTSAWVDWLRDATSEAGLVVDSLLASGRVVMAGMVLAEVLQGARSDSDLWQMADLLAGLEFLDTDKQAWREAALTVSRLRRQGLQLPLSDALIAEVAKQRGVSLYSLDHHFEWIPGLDLYEPEL